jgi:hypothetical protein
VKMQLILASAVILSGAALMAAPPKEVTHTEKSAPLPMTRKQFVCTPLKLTPNDASKGNRIALDVDRAKADIAYNSATNSFNFPDSDFQVILTLQYVPAEMKKNEMKKEVMIKPAAIHLKKAFQKRSGNSWNMLTGIFTPTVFELPLPEDGTLFSLNLGEVNGTIPSYKVECTLEITKIEVNCADCPKNKDR